MEEGLFPHRSYEGDGASIEEERRLAYVAITRAERRLYLTYASTRRVFGSVQTNPPSRFLNEIPREHLHSTGIGSSGLSGVGWEKRGDRRGTFGSGRGSEVYGGRVFGQRTRSTGGSQAAPRRPEPKKTSDVFAVGDQVSHKTFGPGRVIAVEGDMITVQFSRTGQRKKLMRGFAPIVKIEG
jgi:DNA helicase-2/ATP-dependent DNA helicase PcrA